MTGQQIALAAGEGVVDVVEVLDRIAEVGGGESCATCSERPSASPPVKRRT
jgi:hypothetical protein